MYNTVDVSIFTRLWKSPIILEHFHHSKMRNKVLALPLPFSLALHPYHPLNYLCKSPHGSYLFFRGSLQRSTQKVPKAAATQELRPLGWVSIPRAENRFPYSFTLRSVPGKCYNCYFPLALACSHLLNSTFLFLSPSFSLPHCPKRV